MRQTELACRNSWDQDLWEESPNPVLNPALVGIDMEERDILFDSKPVSPNALDLRSPLDARATDDPPQSDPHRAPGLRIGLSRSSAAELEDLDDPRENISAPRRSSVHDARKRLDEERRRARQKQQEAQISEIGDRMTTPDAIGRGDSSSRPLGYLSLPNEKPREIPIAGLHEFPDDPASAPVLPTTPMNESRAGHAQPRRASSTGREAARSNAQETEQLPTHLVRRALFQEGGSRQADESQRRESVPASRVVEPFVHIDGRVPTGVLPPLEDRTRDVSRPDVADPIDRAERLASLPRCCGTCRDFRQVGDGERGQCVNAYAFSDRRMVKSDQLACRSSLGTWWMPNDDVWLERADTSHHGRPTPLLDAAVRAQRSGENGRDSHARAKRVAN